MTTVVAILKGAWIAILMVALCVPILASCAGTMPNVDGRIEVNFDTEEKGEENTPPQKIETE